MKRTLSILLACLMVLSLFTGCGAAPAVTSPTPTPSVAAATPEATPVPEIVDGKFTTKRSITVEVFNRNNDGGSKPEDNAYTKFIKEGMLRDHNVEVTFVPVGRWTEDKDISNLLAAGTAPDVCVTYSYPTIQTYAGMGGVTNLNEYLSQYKDLLPNMWSLLGDDNIYYDQDPTYKSVWAVEAKLFNNARINTFVREDWLKKLNISEPTTEAEFETMLLAFKDNASTLLGADADKMVPFSISYDVGWRGDTLFASHVPDSFTDKDAYLMGFDDRHLLYPGYKDGVKVLNKWYNEGLIWPDFPLYGTGDTTEDNMIKAGYVGSFIHNWDYPYRNGPDGIAANLKTLVGPDAAFIAVDPFKNDAGVTRKFLANPVDRKVFFPATNDEPVASLMYLDWISKLENRVFLQFGQEGITRETQADGAIKLLAVKDDNIMNSPNNIDYTIVINGIDTGDADKNAKSLALGYAGIDARFIEKAIKDTKNEGRIFAHIQVGAIKSEEGQGAALPAKRDVFLDQSVVAPVDQFDAIYDAGMADYLASGGQAIIDERTAKYENKYGK